jgi:hypothetical protein
MNPKEKKEAQNPVVRTLLTLFLAFIAFKVVAGLVEMSQPDPLGREFDRLGEEMQNALCKSERANGKVSSQCQ